MVKGNEEKWKKIGGDWKEKWEERWSLVHDRSFKRVPS